MPKTTVELPEKLAFLFQPARYKFVRGGRGSGKSWGVARALLIQGAQAPHRILCTREIQESIKDSVHRLLSDQIEAMGLTGFYEVLRDEIRGKNGTLFLFKGLSDMTADSVKSFEGCTRVWLEEAQTITRRSWSILTPTIRAPGSEIWGTYNPELETDETHQRAVIQPREDTVSVLMNWRDNPWFPEVLEKERAEDERLLSKAEYRHKWEGECMPAVEGAIYANEIAEVQEQGRIIKLSADPLLRTHAIWDLGWNDAMSIIVAQRAASEIRVIDYIEDTHRPLPSYVEQLKAMPYTWANDWLPHDGFAKRHQTGKSDEEVLRVLEREPLMTPNVEVEQGIRTARLVFPRVWFNDTPAVQRLLECLKRYRRNIIVRTGEAGTPRHDEYSHGADAFRYLALVADQLSSVTTRKKTAREIATGRMGEQAWMG